MKSLFRKMAFGVLFLLLIFLSLGIFFPSVSYNTEQVVALDRASVFDLYNDSSRLPEWLTDIESVDTVKWVPAVVGSQFKIQLKDTPGSEALLETVTAFAKSDSVALSFKAGIMQKEDTFVFLDHDQGCKIIGKHKVTAESYYAKCIFALMKSVFRKTDQQYLDSFAAWATKQ